MKRLMWLLAPALLVLVASALPAVRASAQQPVVTDDNLEQMIANAKTPADHEAIAAFYDKEAADAEAKAKLHHAVEKNYESFHMKPSDMINHCHQEAKYFKDAADQAKAMAADHRKMAQEAGK
ncbi:MAG: hypothetical protein WA005_08855 [Candidatus Binataceae bacterium]